MLVFYTNFGSSKHTLNAGKVTEAVAYLAPLVIPDLVVDGPLQSDFALKSRDDG